MDYSEGGGCPGGEDSTEIATVAPPLAIEIPVDCRYASDVMMQEKIRNIQAAGAGILVANDCGCLMQMEGGLRRGGHPVRTLHLAEILASGRDRPDRSGLRRGRVRIPGPHVGSREGAAG